MPTKFRTMLATTALITALSAPQRASAATLDITTATIAELQAAYATGKLTSERVLDAYLARIAAYDKKGPNINAVILMNPRARAEAKALDKERKAGKVRGPLHGVPIVLKDNIDTFDMQTTAGSQLLKGSVPAKDAFVAKKLRDAGVIVVAKVNLSEFAGSGGSVSGAKEPEVLLAGAVPNGFSSMGLQTRNPHDPARGPAGSSGGTGAAIAAGFAQFGLGTDTGGSVRGPSSVNGIAGLKTTMGLVSRSGIVPLALTLDTAGPMARNVSDVAAALGVMAGVDPADPITQTSAGKSDTDYTKYLKRGALKGARIGIARDFLGKDANVDAVIASSIATLQSLGAVIVDPVKYPDYLLDAKGPVYNLLVASEFKAQLTDYLKTLKPGFPKTFDEIVAKANDPATGYKSPEKAYALTYTASLALDLTDPQYLTLRDHQIPAIRAGMDALFAKYKIDAILYPTSVRPAPLIVPSEPPKPAASTDSATNLANESGYPDLIVPAGMTPEGLPVTVSFFGPAFSEGKLIGYGYDFEQATQARRIPKSTPGLPTDKITY